MEPPSFGTPAYGDKDPIVALATPLTESALALIRTSGSADDAGIGSGAGAIQLLAKFFSRPDALLSAPGNTVVHGWIVDEEKIDEVLVSVYRAPHSYTGEDSADISCHGGIAAVKAVLAALKKAGFREALPGEFTFRAFMNGKLDLTRAESVMELVAAKTHKGREQAVRRLAGVLEREIQAIKAMLVEVLAGTEIYLDYSEDEFLSVNDETEGRLPERKRAEEAAGRLRALAELWRSERIYAEGALAVLAGRPNAGKSSLFNYLVREDRSIVTDTPGTTRDWIEAMVSVEGIPLRLADTAGLRSLSPRPNQKAGGKEAGDIDNNEAERIGVERSFELLEKADIVLYVIDGLKGVTEEDREFFFKFNETSPDKTFIMLWNKTDLAKLPVSLAEDLPNIMPKQLLAVSAKTGKGIPELLRSIASLLAGEVHGGAKQGKITKGEIAGPGSLRQKELVDSALNAVEEALILADHKEPLDIIAPLIRSAVNALGEITGEVSNADILEVMFSRFCVGK